MLLRHSKVEQKVEQQGPHTAPRRVCTSLSVERHGVTFALDEENFLIICRAVGKTCAQSERPIIFYSPQRLGKARYVANALRRKNSLKTRPAGGRAHCVRRAFGDTCISCMLRLSCSGKSIAALSSI